MFFRLSALTHALVDANEETRVLVGHGGCMKIYGKTPNPLLALNADEHTGWCPPVISWFINPINYSYIYHKPNLWEL